MSVSADPIIQHPGDGFAFAVNGSSQGIRFDTSNDLLPYMTKPGAVLMRFDGNGVDVAQLNADATCSVLALDGNRVLVDKKVCDLMSDFARGQALQNMPAERAAVCAPVVSPFRTAVGIELGGYIVLAAVIFGLVFGDWRRR